MTRPTILAIGLSVLIHAGLLVLVLNREPRAPVKLYDVPESIEVRVVPASGPGSLPGTQEGQPASPSTRRSQPRIDTQKLFALTAPEASGEMSLPSESPIADLENQAPEGGQIGFEAWGENASNPFWTHFARGLHERIRFLGDVHHLESSGTVVVSMRFLPDGSIDPKSLRSESKSRYLQVFVLRELCRAYCESQTHMASLIGNHDPGKIFVKVRFVSGSQLEYERDPLPIIRSQGVDLERRRRVSSMQIGATNLFGSSSDTAENRLNLGWNIELESLFSRSHRKRFGWSGTKVKQEQRRALKQELDHLWTSYRQRGWI